MTPTTALAVLLVRSGSAVALLTVAVLVALPPGFVAVTCTGRSIEVEAPAASAPTVHVNVFAVESYVQPDGTGVLESAMIPDGSGSVSSTPVASLGPLLMTVRSYSNLWLGLSAVVMRVTPSVSTAALLRIRSAPGMIPWVRLAVLFD